MSLTSRVGVAPSDILKLINTAAAVLDHAPHKDVIVHLSRWLVHCAAICCNPKTVSLLQETEYDLDIDSDTISDNSDTDVSDNDTVKSGLQILPHIHPGPHINNNYLHECQMFGIYFLTLGLPC